MERWAYDEAVGLGLAPYRLRALCLVHVTSPLCSMLDSHSTGRQVGSLAYSRSAAAWEQRQGPFFALHEPVQTAQTWLSIENVNHGARCPLYALDHDSAARLLPAPRQVTHSSVEAQSGLRRPALWSPAALQGRHDGGYLEPEVNQAHAFHLGTHHVLERRRISGLPKRMQHDHCQRRCTYCTCNELQWTRLLRAVD